LSDRPVPPVRALGLLPYPLDHVPGQRFRIEQWARFFAVEEIEVSFSPFLSELAMDVLYMPGRRLRKATETLRGYLRRMRELRQVRDFDVAFVYREAALLGPPILERRFARRVPLVFDFDDAIYLPASSAPNRWAAWLKDRLKTGKLCRLAAHVTVGNEVLAEYARPRSRAVTVVPTTIDTDLYLPEARTAQPLPVVGWTGSVTTLPYLVQLEEALRVLRRKVAYRLLVIGGELAVPDLDVECRPWRAATEIADLRPIDVGLMPLPDDPWTRGKCGLKALQYMALGIPPVVAPVGINGTIVENGVNGFHARTNAEWVERVACLLKDPGLRRRLGDAARRTVVEGYSAAVHAKRVAAVLRSVATGN
jgi:glycosyltransferase involved in cell wall biosynthesis